MCYGLRPNSIRMVGLRAEGVGGCVPASACPYLFPSTIIACDFRKSGEQTVKTIWCWMFHRLSWKSLSIRLAERVFWLDSKRHEIDFECTSCGRTWTEQRR